MRYQPVGTQFGKNSNTRVVRLISFAAKDLVQELTGTDGPDPEFDRYPQDR